MSETLTTVLTKLHQCRSLLSRLEAEFSEAKVRFEASQADLLQAINDSWIAVRELDDQCRALALTDFKQTGDVKPAPGVSIQMRTVMAYDETEAFAWAKRTQMALVPESLDRKAFEKIANTTPLPFVQITKEPRVAIATDLSPVVQESSV